MDCCKECNQDGYCESFASQVSLSIDEQDGRWYIYDSEYEPHFMGPPFNYCPWCGKKL